MNHNEGWSVALIGLVIGVLTVGLGVWGWLGALTYEQYEKAGPSLGIAAVGGIIGLVLFFAGVGQATSREQGRTSSVSKQSCQRCGSHLRGNPQTCSWCGQERPLG